MDLVFVYGTLKGGHGNHHYLGKSKFTGIDRTRRLYLMDTVGFPTITRHPEGYPVEGEVYEVSKPTLDRLDFLEGNGQMYQRVLTELKSGRTAWVYEWLLGLGSEHTRVPADQDGILRWRPTVRRTRNRQIRPTWLGITPKSDGEIVGLTKGGTIVQYDEATNQFLDMGLTPDKFGLENIMFFEGERVGVSRAQLDEARRLKTPPVYAEVEDPLSEVPPPETAPEEPPPVHNET